MTEKLNRLCKCRMNDKPTNFPKEKTMNMRELQKMLKETLARIERLEAKAKQRGMTTDAIYRTADAVARDSVLEHLTGQECQNSPRTSNHLAALAKRNGDSARAAQKLNEINAARYKR